MNAWCAATKRTRNEQSPQLSPLQMTAYDWVAIIVMVGVIVVGLCYASGGNDDGMGM